MEETKRKYKVKSKQSLRAINKCLMIVPNIKVEVIKNIYEMICKSKMLHKVQIWSLKKGLEITDEI
jgi:hypothetical protein